jgi:hypothetical protein
VDTRKSLIGRVAARTNFVFVSSNRQCENVYVEQNVHGGSILYRVDAADFVANHIVVTMNARLVVGIFSPAQAPPRTAGRDTIYFRLSGTTMVSVVLGFHTADT